MPSGVEYGELGESLPAISSLNASYSQTSMSSSRPQYVPLPRSERRTISDVRRTFCLFVTFDLLFISLLWIIELNINKSIWLNLEKEVVRYDFRSSFFDIFLLALFRFLCLQISYAAFKLRHWWVIAITTLVTSAFLIAKVIISDLFTENAFGYVLPITSFVVAWLETWFLDFKVLTQEAQDERGIETISQGSSRSGRDQKTPKMDGQLKSFNPRSGRSTRTTDDVLV